ncbi:carbohydrate ABC transporter permease [Mycoplasma crocodyli]|uniref:Sugar ABC transporter, permease n=1 Tax=Mycoplasma crocodyli (strain ATCC 51981 / MP145) TaxID=512564 RepID=D5E6B2_MYCCM|nr:sugar ABC transporter permease [Mycoplasma crocodyli]ADE19495.1 sugar ABC transporter, permease [Mycoplasma crocodyli MP145]
MTNMYAWIAKTFPFLFKYGTKKVAAKKPNISASYLEKKTPFYKPFLLILPGVIIISLFTIAPFFITIKDAFLPLDNPADPQSAHFSLDGFKYLLKDPLYGVALRNSLLYGLLSLPIIISISLIISSAISLLYKKWARGLWQTIFFLPYVTSGVAISLTFINIFDAKFGVINSAFGVNIAWLTSGNDSGWNAFVAMFILGIWQNLAFNILIFTTAMLSVDKNLYKSASIDGSGTVKQFFKITLPSINKTTTFLITIGVIGGIKVFPLALFSNNPAEAILNGGSTLMLYVYNAVISSRFSDAGVASIFLFLIGVAFSTILRGGFDIVIKLANQLGERNVQTKINSTKLIR